MTETSIVGIDFSGREYPGRKIWITEGRFEGGKLKIESSEPASEVFDGRGRAEIFDRLRDYCRSNNDAVIGLDFPFGFPEQAVETNEWITFLEEFAAEFKGKSIDAYPGKFEMESQQRREVDYRYAGQSPMSPQVQYQVFYGVRDLLYPLVCEQEKVRVAPMQSLNANLPTLIEVYPAATLGRLGLYRTGYKNSPGAQNRRDDTVGSIENSGNVDLSGIDTQRITESDDALDSLVAAVATHEAMQNGLDEDLDNQVEGYIYA